MYSRDMKDGKGIFMHVQPSICTNLQPKISADVNLQIPFFIDIAFVNPKICLNNGKGKKPILCHFL